MHLTWLNDDDWINKYPRIWARQSHQTLFDNDDDGDNTDEDNDVDHDYDEQGEVYSM